MADDPDPIDQLIEAALFVPVGLLLELRERFPELADKGRQHLTTQVAMARMVGQFAVKMGTQQVSAFLARQRSADEAERRPGTEPRPSAPTDGAAAPVGEAPAPDEPDVAPPAPVATGDLPIAGYDTLAASQVVARLDALDAAERRVIAAYEAAHRNRKTILGKISQLQRVS